MNVTDPYATGLTSLQRVLSRGSCQLVPRPRYASLNWLPESNTGRIQSAKLLLGRTSEKGWEKKFNFERCVMWAKLVSGSYRTTWRGFGTAKGVRNINPEQQ